MAECTSDNPTVDEGVEQTDSNDGKVLHYKSFLNIVTLLCSLLCDDHHYHFYLLLAIFFDILEQKGLQQYKQLVGADDDNDDGIWDSMAVMAAEQWNKGEADEIINVKDLLPNGLVAFISYSIIHHTNTHTYILYRIAINLCRN